MFGSVRSPWLVVAAALMGCGSNLVVEDDDATAGGAAGATASSTTVAGSGTSVTSSSSTTSTGGGGGGGGGGEGGGGSALEPVQCDPTGPTPQQLATATHPAAALALGPTHVAWLEPKMNAIYEAKGSVHAIPRCGGDPILVADEQGFPWGLAIDGQTLFWTNVGTYLNGSLQGGAVMRAALGGLPVPMTIFENDPPKGLAIDHQNAFWVADWKIRTLPKTALQDFAATVGNVAYGDALALDDTTVYLVGGGLLSAIAKAGGAPTSLFDGACSPAQMGAGVTVDASHVYWLDGCGTLRRIPKTGGGADVLASEQTGGVPAMRGIAVDDLHVYWLSSSHLMRVDKAGGTPESLAPVSLISQIGYLGGVALSETDVYWSANMGVWRLTKP